MTTLQLTDKQIEAASAVPGDDGHPDIKSAEVVRGEPVWRVVGGSLATGFFGALALILGVFAGAEEHVISGSALLAFAAGWALLAELSRRFTSQPQRWAQVPAGVMAAAGVVLLVARPADRALDAAGWIWPPFAVGLSCWMFLQLRRRLRGRARWLVYPVVAALVLGSLGAFFETAARRHDRAAYPAPGVLYDVGGHRLHIDCSGSGSPTVVLQSGLGGSSAHWARIVADVSRTTRVCAYDRAGQGWSDDGVARPDGLLIATELHTLLQRSGEVGPYVMVGHSAGGTYAMTYAAQYPDDVAGLVLLDSMSPYQFETLPDFSAEYSMMRRGLGVLPSITRLGLAQVMPSSAFSSLPEPAASQVRAFSTSPRLLRNMRDEQAAYREVFEQARGLTTLGDTPLIVVTATESLQEITGWDGAQQQLVTLSTHSRRLVIDSSHSGLLDDARSYRSAAQAVADVVQAIRSTA